MQAFCLGEMASSTPCWTYTCCSRAIFPDCWMKFVYDSPNVPSKKLLYRNTVCLALLFSAEHSPFICQLIASQQLREEACNGFCNICCAHSVTLFLEFIRYPVPDMLAQFVFIFPLFLNLQASTGITSGFVIVKRKPLWLMDTADRSSLTCGAIGPWGRFGGSQSNLEGIIVTHQRLRPGFLWANDAPAVCRLLSKEHSGI